MFDAATSFLIDEARAQREQLFVQNDRRQVLAPIDGEVLIVYKQQGSYVTAGTPLALIGQFDRLLFSIPLEDKLAKQFALDQTVELRIQRRDLQKAYDTEYSSATVGNDEHFLATVREITPPPDEPSTIRKILFELDNRAGLLEPQTYGGITLRSTAPKRCLTIPLSAMLNSDRSEVFIVQPDNTLSIKKVVTGADVGTNVEIINGLGEGAVVITSNPHGLVEGMKVDVTIGGARNGSIGG